MDIFRLLHIFLPNISQEESFPCEPRCKNIIEKHAFDEKKWDETLGVVNKFINKISSLRELQPKMKLSCLLGIARLWSDTEYKHYIEDPQFLNSFALESLNNASHNHCTLNNGPAENKFKEGFKLMKDLYIQKISELISRKETAEPYKKQTIPPSKKTEIWSTYIGIEKGQTKCFICRTNDITQTSFEAGHIQPEKLGGTMDISNLRPICKQCNGSQNILHMKVFIDKNFPGREIIKPII